MSAPGPLLLLLALATIPPLNDSQRERLALAHDDRDHQEEAFVALREHVESWPAAAAPDLVPPSPDLEVMVGVPEVFRGRLYLMEGVIQQREPLPPPHDGVDGWIIRSDDGRPFVVYVCGLGPDYPFRDGQRVVLIGRFYKRLTMTARDGQERQYAAFVAAQPRTPPDVAPGSSSLWMIAPPVAVLIVVFGCLLLFARRRPPGAAARRSGGPPAEEIPAPDPPLPADAADALAELRRRADAPGAQPD